MANEVARILEHMKVAILAGAFLRSQARHPAGYAS